MAINDTLTIYQYILYSITKHNIHWELEGQELEELELEEELEEPKELEEQEEQEQEDQTLEWWQAPLQAIT